MIGIIGKFLVSITGLSVGLMGYPIEQIARFGPRQELWAVRFIPPASASSSGRGAHHHANWPEEKWASVV